LVCCGNEGTQITWMDAACEGTVFTPRHGRPVEVNALWYHALRLVARRARDNALADQCRSLIRKIGSNFSETFWNKEAQCLFDCVRDDGPDASIRPNQIFAVSLPHSPLPCEQRKAVLGVVTDELLTPCGLRTLSPEDYRYFPRYGGSPYDRDRAYHNGTVWPWLLGPYVEAHLRVQEFSAQAKEHGRRLLQPLIDHLSEAGLGTVSEIFDAEARHTPRGCPAQAWSVAELLRTWELTRPDTAVSDPATSPSAVIDFENLPPGPPRLEAPEHRPAGTKQD
jgi:glycogen debranching enzyme